MDELVERGPGGATLADRADRVGRHEAGAAVDGIADDGRAMEEVRPVIAQREVVERAAAIFRHDAAGPAFGPDASLVLHDPRDDGPQGPPHGQHRDGDAGTEESGPQEVVEAVGERHGRTVRHARGDSPRRPSEGKSTMVVPGRDDLDGGETGSECDAESGDKSRDRMPTGAQLRTALERGRAESEPGRRSSRSSGLLDVRALHEVTHDEHDHQRERQLPGPTLPTQECGRERYEDDAERSHDADCGLRSAGREDAGDETCRRWGRRRRRRVDRKRARGDGKGGADATRPAADRDGVGRLRALPNEEQQPEHRSEHEAEDVLVSSQIGEYCGLEHHRHSKQQRQHRGSEGDRDCHADGDHRHRRTRIAIGQMGHGDAEPRVVASDDNDMRTEVHANLSSSGDEQCPAAADAGFGQQQDDQDLGDRAEDG